MPCFLLFILAQKLFINASGDKISCSEICSPFLNSDQKILKNECIYYLMKYVELNCIEIILKIQSKQAQDIKFYRGFIDSKYGIIIYLIIFHTIENLEINGLDRDITSLLYKNLIQNTIQIEKLNTSTIKTYEEYININFYKYPTQELFKNLMEIPDYREPIFMLTCSMLTSLLTDFSSGIFVLLKFLNLNFEKDIKKNPELTICMVGHPFDHKSCRVSHNKNVNYELKFFSLLGISEVFCDIFKSPFPQNIKNKVIICSLDFTNCLFDEITKRLKILKKIDFKKMKLKLDQNIENIDKKNEIPEKYLNLIKKKDLNIMIHVYNDFSFEKLYGKLNIFLSDSRDLSILNVLEKNKNILVNMVDDAFKLFEKFLYRFKACENNMATNDNKISYRKQVLNSKRKIFNTKGRNIKEIETYYVQKYKQEIIKRKTCLKGIKFISLENIQEEKE